MSQPRKSLGLEKLKLFPLLLEPVAFSQMETPEEILSLYCTVMLSEVE